MASDVRLGNARLRPFYSLRFKGGHLLSFRLGMRLKDIDLNLNSMNLCIYYLTDLLFTTKCTYGLSKF